MMPLRARTGEFAASRFAFFKGKRSYFLYLSK